MISKASVSYALVIVVSVLTGVSLKAAYQQHQDWPEAPELAGFRVVEPSAEPSPAPRLLCDVVATVELEKIVGEPLVGPKSAIIHDNGLIQSQTCLWSAASGAYTPTISILLQNGERVWEPQLQNVAATSSAAASASAVSSPSAEISQPVETQTVWQFEQARNRTRPGYTELENVGDMAYISPTGLYVLSGDRMLRVFVSVSDRKQNQSVMEQIARLTLTAIAFD